MTIRHIMMVRTTLYICVLLFTSICAEAQFVHHVRFGPLNDSPYSFAKIKGGYVSCSLSGRTQSPPYDKNRQRICFTNDDGSHRWITEIFVDTVGEVDQTLKILVLNDEIYSFSRFGAGFRAEIDVKLSKLNIHGDVLWEKVYPHPFYNNLNTATITNDSSAFVILGFQEDPYREDTSSYKVFLQKIDTAGNEIWFREFLPPPNMVSFGPFSVQVHPNDDIYFQVMGGNRNSLNPYNEDPYIYVCDSNGRLKRRFEYNNDYIQDKENYWQCVGSDYMKLIEEDKMIARYCRDDINIGWGSANVDVTYFVLDTLGNVLKERHIEQQWGENHVYGMSKARNGDLLLSGEYNGRMYEFETPFAHSSGSLMRLTRDLEIVWFRRYFLNKAASYFSDLLDQDEYGNITLLTRYSRPGITAGTDGAIVQLDSNGCFTPDCGETDLYDFVSSTGPFQSADLTKELQVFPNPASERIRVLAKDPYDKIEVYDLRGRLMGAFPPTESGIDISHLTSGMYLIRVLSGVRLVGSARFVVH